MILYILFRYYFGITTINGPSFFDAFGTIDVLNKVKKLQLIKIKTGNSYECLNML